MLGVVARLLAAAAPVHRRHEARIASSHVLRGPCRMLSLAVVCTAFSCVRTHTHVRADQGQPGPLFPGHACVVPSLRWCQAAQAAWHTPSRRRLVQGKVTRGLAATDCTAELSSTHTQTRLCPKAPHPCCESCAHTHMNMGLEPGTFLFACGWGGGWVGQQMQPLALRCRTQWSGRLAAPPPTPPPDAAPFATAVHMHGRALSGRLAAAPPRRAPDEYQLEVYYATCSALWMRQPFYTGLPPHGYVCALRSRISCNLHAEWPAATRPCLHQHNHIRGARSGGLDAQGTLLLAAPPRSCSYRGRTLTTSSWIHRVPPTRQEVQLLTGRFEPGCMLRLCAAQCAKGWAGVLCWW